MSPVGRPAESRVRAIGRWIETTLLNVLLFGIIVLAVLQILLRNFFSVSLFWADDLIRMGILWLAVVGGVAASREGRHIAISIVPRYCPESWHTPAAVIAASFAAIVTAMLSWHSFRFVADSYAFGDTVFGDLPAWAFQSVMPIGFALMSIQFGLQTVARLRDRQ